MIPSKKNIPEISRNSAILPGTVQSAVVLIRAISAYFGVHRCLFLKKIGILGYETLCLTCLTTLVTKNWTKHLQGAK